MTAPDVSVIMNCYNGSIYLGKAIESVILQTYKNWELIFWDNKSTDNSASILKKYRDKRIKYFISDTHTSQYEARRKAVLKAEGNYIAFLDVDDWWEPKKIEKQLKLFSNDQIGFVCNNYLIVNERKNTISKAFKDIPSGYILNDLLKRNFVGMSTLMIKKKCYFDLDYGFDPKFEIIGDYDLVLRLASKYKLGATNEILSSYRWHGNNLGIIKFDLNIRELEIWINENKHRTEFSSKKNFDYLKDYTKFYKGLNKIINHDRAGAFKIVSTIKSYVFKLKLLIILIMPLAIIKALRS